MAEFANDIDMKEAEQQLLNGGLDVTNPDPTLSDVDEDEILDVGGGVAQLGALNDEAANRLLDGAKHTQAVQKNQLALEKEIHSLNLKLDEVTTILQKTELERREANAENAELKKAALMNETQSKKADIRRKAARTALADSFKGSDVDAARMWRSKQPNDEPIRTVIDASSPLHPDYKCGQCGGRDLKKCLKDPELQPLVPEGYRFSSMRECAALLDMRERWSSLYLVDARKEMAQKADSKEVSYNGLKSAYKMLCVHAMSDWDAVAKTGVFVEGEDTPVSDAITSVLMRGGKRKTRKSLVILVPSNSAVVGSKGLMKDVEEVIYDDEPELRSVLQSMEAAGNFPKSLFILLKTTFPTKTLNVIRAYCEDAVTKVETTIYIAADLLPVEKEEVKEEMIKEHQKWLTLWRMDKPAVNMVIVTPLSGTIFGHYPFATLFRTVEKESKIHLEGAVKHIVEGAPFELGTLRQKRIAVPTKRSSSDSVWEGTVKKGCEEESTLRRQSSGRGGRGGRRDSNVPWKCYNCGERTTSHMASNCPKPKKINTSDE